MVASMQSSAVELNSRETLLFKSKTTFGLMKLKDIFRTDKTNSRKT